MRLNKSTSQAIRILVECARADGAYVKVADISERLDITLQNVFKIVHLLSRAELVSALRGRNGGVRLTRPAAAIRVGDVVRAMETMGHDAESEAGEAGDRRTVADVHKVIDKALDAFVAILDQHTLADLARGKGPKPTKRKRSLVGSQRRDTTAQSGAARSLARRT